MNYRALALGAAVGFLFALMPSCGGQKCGAANCAGCCDKDGKCQNAANTAACGASGNVCKACQATETCSAGQCVPGNTVTGDGGTDGGNPTSQCANCSTGCCFQGTCFLGTTMGQCGTGGAACQACNATAGEQCLNKKCQAPDAGSTGAGAVGAPCTTASQCTAISPAGNPNICKTTTLMGNRTYPGGYCTRRCIADEQCGPNGTCVYWIGPFGEPENICLRKCAGPGTPPTQGVCEREAEGYTCLNLNSQANPDWGCWMKDFDGGTDINFYELVDAGPSSNEGVMGGPCSDAAQCKPPETGFCVPPSTDAGPTPYVGGMCSADCTLGLFNESFCGDGGICWPYAFRLPSQPNADPFVIWECEGFCDTRGTPGCRTGYACDPASAQTTIGHCVPRCDNPGGGCATGSTCNTANGLCE